LSFKINCIYDVTLKKGLEKSLTSIAIQSPLGFYFSAVHHLSLLAVIAKAASTNPDKPRPINFVM
jgi:hypothetical protein